MRLRATLIGLLLDASVSLFAATQPVTTNNYDSCDISPTPAATLLLPYFELDTAAAQGTGTTTLFSVVNTSRYPQIAHVTVWTDWGYPVQSFNLFLTGYDVQGINLFDVIVRGTIASTFGTSITTVPGTPQNGFSGTPSTPLNNTANPNFALTGPADVRQSCNGLPGTIPSDLTNAVKNALTTGTGYVSSAASCGSGQIGFNHGTIAKGYITIDVVSYCTTQLPTDSNYYAGPNAALLFDNVLAGDYQVLGPTPVGSGTASTFDAEGGPLVHIHAVPEGGPSGAGGGLLVSTNLPFTFYDRYTPLPARTADRRQPLPSAWMSRYIQGGVNGLATDLKIWREGITNNSLACSSSQYAVNSNLLITQIVRFDEHENSYGFGSFGFSASGFVPVVLTLPATSKTTSFGSVFPTLTGFDVGGWFYLNLSNGAVDGFGGFGACRPVLSAQRGGFGTCANQFPGDNGSRTTSQNWVIASMFGAVGSNRMSVDFDAVALGNGCTPAPPAGAPIGPATQKNGLVCPSNANVCSNGTLPPPVNP